MQRRVVVVGVVCALVVALGAGGWSAWQAWTRTSYEQAVAWLPKPTLRATYTDWADARALAHGTSIGPGSSDQQIAGFLNRAYDLDLTSTSALVDSTAAMNRIYGFSPLEAQWEMYGQSREGSVDVLRLRDSVDLADLERNLRGLGYTPPAQGAGTGGVWAGTTDLVTQIDPSLTPVMQNLVVLPDQHVVLLSDSAAYASAAASVVKGDEPGLDDVPGTTTLAQEAGQPATAVLFASDFACDALSMADADEQDQAQAKQLVAAAGGVNPLAGVVIAMHPDRSLVVGLHFESSDEASQDLRPRVRLASGDAPGQGGTFGERFHVKQAVADGNEIVMQLQPAARNLSLISDLTDGPLLFASC